MIPIPLFFIPMPTSRWATKHTKFYQKKIPQALFDKSVVSLTLWGSLLFVISGFDNIGVRKLKNFEAHIQEELKEFPPETAISFSKGL